MRIFIKISKFNFASIVLVLCWIFSSLLCIAQTELPLRIANNLTIDEGTVTVSGTHYVQKGATLTLSGEATLIFDANATIRVDGALNITGKSKNLINITSADKQNPGNGIVINGVSSNQNINIEYARFDFIKKPISFEFRWSRNTVNVANNVFRRSLYEGAAIEIREIDNLLTENKIHFDLKNNTFSNSTSSFLISNITSDLLTINFENNVITRNEYTGRSRNGIFTSPLYMTYNTYQKNDVPQIYNNSVFDNFYSLYYEDTLELGRTNVSVIGNADKLDLSGNYFGNPNKQEIQKTFDFISANYQAPFLFFENALSLPSDKLNGHFYEININGKELDERAQFSKYKDEIKNIELRFNRPVVNGEDFGVLYHFAKKDSIKTVAIKSNLKWSEGNTVVKINIQEKLKNYSESGYLEIDGFYDINGMNVPILSLGKKGILDRNLRNYIPTKIPKRVTTINDVELSPDDTLVIFEPSENTFVQFESLNDSFIHLREKYFDYGVFMGNAVYFGDVNSTTISANMRSMRPNLGIRLGYQATERLRLELRSSAMLIAGSDLPQKTKDRNPRGTGFDRDLSFRTSIVDAALLAEYNLSTFKLKSTYIPSIFVGGNVYYFNPQGKVKGDSRWYSLRTIGTEGQTLDGRNSYILDNDNTTRLSYKKIMYGIPFGASIKRHLTQKTIVSFSYTYNKIFTDYLDDISTGYYPEPESLKAANPGLGPVAVTLSNPSNQPLTKRRAYSDDYDGYGYWGVTFTFKIY